MKDMIIAVTNCDVHNNYLFYIQCCISCQHETATVTIENRSALEKFHTVLCYNNSTCSLFKIYFVSESSSYFLLVNCKFMMT